MAALQEQLDSMSIVQCDMAQYLQQLSRNYRNIVQEMLNFRNIVNVQDQLMHNLIQYTVKGNPGQSFSILWKTPQAIDFDFPS